MLVHRASFYRSPQLRFDDTESAIVTTGDTRLEIENAVNSHLRDCPAGPLQLVVSNFDPGTSFDFLGHELSVCPETGEAVANLSHRTHERLIRRLEALSNTEPGLSFGYPLEAIACVDEVIRSQSMAIDAEEWQQFYLSTLLDLGLNQSPFSSVL